ncbi:MAG TPA: hypothetical protein VF381_11985 [Thermoanaerobaculia bacterium]
MKRILPILAVTLILSAGAGWLTGTWQAEVHGEAKTFPIVLHFTVDPKGNIGGTVEFPTHDTEFPITQGTVHGNEISFLGAGSWSGKLEGSDLKLTRELDGGKKQVMVAHRAAH